MPCSLTSFPELLPPLTGNSDPAEEADGGRRDGIQIYCGESSLRLRFLHFKKRRAFCLIVVGSVRPTVHQPFALDAFQGEIPAHLIVNSEPDAVRIPSFGRFLPRLAGRWRFERRGLSFPQS